MKNTKDEIKNQLIKMLKNNHITKVKVKDITDALHIGRSTFYLYFDSVYSVLQEIEDEYFAELKKISASFWDYKIDPKYCETPHPLLYNSFSYMHENREISNVLWGPYGDPVFQVGCKRMLKEAFFPKNKAVELFPYDTELHTNFIIGGHMEILNLWLKNDHGVSAEDFACGMYFTMFTEVLHRMYPDYDFSKYYRKR